MTSKKRRFLSEDHIYRDLTIALLLMLSFSPLLVWLTGSYRTYSYVTSAFLLFALYEITRRTTDIAIALGLGFLAFAGSVVNANTPDTPEINLGPTILGGLFIGFLVWRILKDVLKGSRVTSERVYGAVCAYLLIGFFFTEIYGFIVLIDPGALTVSDAIRATLTSGDISAAREVLSYFSFVTMTTLGYGDISPVSSAARTIAWIQALIGQLYLAIMIAGLVGIHIASHSKREPGGQDD